MIPYLLNEFETPKAILPVYLLVQLLIFEDGEARRAMMDGLEKIVCLTRRTRLTADKTER